MSGLADRACILVKLFRIENTREKYSNLQKGDSVGYECFKIFIIGIEYRGGKYSLFRMARKQNGIICDFSLAPTRIT